MAQRQDMTQPWQEPQRPQLQGLTAWRAAATQRAPALREAWCAQRDLEAVAAQRQDMTQPWQESQRSQLQAALEDPLRRQSARESLVQLVHCPSLQRSQQALPQVRALALQLAWPSWECGRLDVT